MVKKRGCVLQLLGVEMAGVFTAAVGSELSTLNIVSAVSLR